MCTVTFTRITPAGTMAIGMPESGTRVAGSNRAESNIPLPTSALMPLQPVVSEFADYCPVFEETAVLRWTDSELEEQICEDCADSLGYAEHAL
jgi:hypothetical protein